MSMFDQFDGVLRNASKTAEEAIVDMSTPTKESNEILREARDQNGKNNQVNLPGLAIVESSEPAAVAVTAATDAQFGRLMEQLRPQYNNNLTEHFVDPDSPKSREQAHLVLEGLRSGSPLASVVRAFNLTDSKANKNGLLNMLKDYGVENPSAFIRTVNKGEVGPQIRDAFADVYERIPPGPVRDALRLLGNGLATGKLDIAQLQSKLREAKFTDDEEFNAYEKALRPLLSKLGDKLGLSIGLVFGGDSRERPRSILGVSISDRDRIGISINIPYKGRSTWTGRGAYAPASGPLNDQTISGLHESVSRRLLRRSP
jgi:hypothetical protein